MNSPLHAQIDQHQQRPQQRGEEQAVKEAVLAASEKGRQSSSKTVFGGDVAITKYIQ